MKEEWKGNWIEVPLSRSWRVICKFLKIALTLRLKAEVVGGYWSSDLDPLLDLANLTTECTQKTRSRNFLIFRGELIDTQIWGRTASKQFLASISVERTPVILPPHNGSLISTGESWVRFPGRKIFWILFASVNRRGSCPFQPLSFSIPWSSRCYQYFSFVLWSHLHIFGKEWEEWVRVGGHRSDQTPFKGEMWPDETMSSVIWRKVKLKSLEWVLRSGVTDRRKQRSKFSFHSLPSHSSFQLCRLHF